jgi:hypothetical protein
MLAQAGVSAYSRPLAGGDRQAARAIAAWVRTLPRPVAVIAPRTPFSNDKRYPGTEAAAAFQDAYAALPTASAASVARAMTVPAAGARR